jgi:hypothetical protein
VAPSRVSPRRGSLKAPTIPSARRKQVIPSEGGSRDRCPPRRRSRNPPETEPRSAYSQLLPKKRCDSEPDRRQVLQSGEPRVDRPQGWPGSRLHFEPDEAETETSLPTPSPREGAGRRKLAEVFAPVRMLTPSIRETGPQAPHRPHGLPWTGVFSTDSPSLASTTWVQGPSGRPPHRVGPPWDNRKASEHAAPPQGGQQRERYAEAPECQAHPLHSRPAHGTKPGSNRAPCTGSGLPPRSRRKPAATDRKPA